MDPLKSIPNPIKNCPPSARHYTVPTYNAPIKSIPIPVKKYPPSSRFYTIPTYSAPIKNYIHCPLKSIRHLLSLILSLHTMELLKIIFTSR